MRALACKHALMHYEHTTAHKIDGMYECRYKLYPPRTYEVDPSEERSAEKVPNFGGSHEHKKRPV